MNYAKIRQYDIANGEGVRTSLFVSGCTHRCPGCFNQDEQDFCYGKKFTDETAEEILKLVSEPMISGLSILGGDPMCQDADGLQALSDLCERVHKIGKTVWLWTGFLWEDILYGGRTDIEIERKILLLMSDVIVDGPFMENLSSMALVWKGSSNQRVIDVVQSIKACGKVVLYHT